MQTILLLSSNQEFFAKNINQIKRDLRVSTFDITEIKTELALGIDDVKKIIRESIHKPYSGTNRLVIIQNFHLSTPEAQNALLKYLEEARESLTIVLTAEREQNIISTVISRSHLIKDHEKKLHKNIDIYSILSMAKGERLLFLQKNITTKDSAFEFINNLSATLEHELLQKPELEIAQLIKKVGTAGKYLEANVNFKLVLDILLLGFPKLKTQSDPGS